MVCTPFVVSNYFEQVESFEALVSERFYVRDEGEFLVKRQVEKTPVKFRNTNFETYNAPFSASELQAALLKSHDTAPGPDEIPYQLLKHLPESMASILLQIFNKYWEMTHSQKHGIMPLSSQSQNQAKMIWILPITAQLR